MKTESLTTSFAFLLFHNPFKYIAYVLEICILCFCSIKSKKNGKRHHAHVKIWEFYILWKKWRVLHFLCSFRGCTTGENYTEDVVQFSFLHRTDLRPICLRQQKRDLLRRNQNLLQWSRKHIKCSNLKHSEKEH